MKYTRKHILEALKYWRKKLDESSLDGKPLTVGELINRIDQGLDTLDEQVRQRMLAANAHIGLLGKFSAIGDIESVVVEGNKTILAVKRNQASASRYRGPVEGCISLQDLMKQIVQQSPTNEVYIRETPDALSLSLGKTATLSPVVSSDIGPQSGVWLRV